MNEELSNHHHQLIDIDNVPPAAMHPPSGHFERLEFLDILRHPVSDSASTFYDGGQQAHPYISQGRPELVTHAPTVAVDNTQYAETCNRGVARRHKGHPRALTGPALESRRRLAQDRISQGGWKPEIAELAIEYIGQVTWYDRTSQVWGARCFVRDAEALGELCKDLKAIRGFLDSNIHKFIAIHAMAKDSRVPNWLVRKADQRTADWVFKYPWLRSFIREYQGKGRSTVQSLVQAYKDRGGADTTENCANQQTEVEQDGNNGIAMPMIVASVVMNTAGGHENATQSTERPEMTLQNKKDSRKRRRSSDGTEDFEFNDLMKKVKRESTEDGLNAGRGRTQETGTCEISRTEGDDNRGMMHPRGRSLTVSFHGMRSPGAEESDHVQVYVPRTSKSVTINFL